MKDASDKLLETTTKVSKGDPNSLAMVDQIKDRLTNLRKALPSTRTEQVDSKALVERIKAIFTLFEQLAGDTRWKTAILETETNVVLAHASARKLADAASIIKDPKRALILNFNENWSFTGENEPIAAEFQVRIPIFLGFRVLAEGRPPDIIITLRSDPRHTGNPGNAPLERLRTEVERLLAWELRKIGFTMEYEVNVFADLPPE